MSDNLLVIIAFSRLEGSRLEAVKNGFPESFGYLAENNVFKK